MKSILKGIGLAGAILFALALCILLAYGENVTSGTNAGARITTGDANVFIGESAGAYTTTGVGNIFVGYSTGNRNATGSRNIFLGYLSGMGLTGSDRFVLRNYPNDTVLYAHMDSGKVAINATNALGYNLYVSGTAKITGATTYSTVTADSITSGRFLSSLTGGANNAAISPSGDKDTGLYWLTATGNRIGITAKGTQVALFDSVGTGVTTGTAAAPSFHNLNDRDTGLYWLTATGNRLGVAAKGVSHAIIDSIGVAVRGKVEIRENVIPLTDSLLVLRDSLGKTVAWIDSLGKVHADTLHATNIVATGYGITDGAGIVRGGLTVTGSASADTTKGTNAAFTGYSITNGAGIVRGGLTVTGSASADTTKGTNAAFTGYGIVDGATIFRGGTTATVVTADSVTVGRFLSSLTGGVNNAAISPSGDKDTGLYWLTATGNRMGVTTGGIKRAVIDSTGLTINGTDQSTTSIPGFQITASADAYPLFMIHPYTHDNVSIFMDAYWDGTIKSSDAGSNFAINKYADVFSLQYSTGIAAGSAVTYSNGFTMSNAGAITIPKTLIVGNATSANSKTVFGVRGAVGAQDSLLTLRSSLNKTVAFVDTLGNANFEGTISGLQNVVVSDDAIAPTAAQSGTMWVARPLTAKRTATLPAAAAGLNYTFFVDDADSLLITTASGDSLITNAGVAWKTTSSIAGTLKVWAYDATRWLMVFSAGTWTSY